jgi:hypothetical protein
MAAKEGKKRIRNRSDSAGAAENPEKMLFE